MISPLSLQKIYDSEINIRISGFWDGGIEVRLGDEMNGYVAEETVASVADILSWLQEAIAHFYPDSIYAAPLASETRERAAIRLFQPPRIGASVACPHCGAPNAALAGFDEHFACSSAPPVAIRSRSIRLKCSEAALGAVRGLAESVMRRVFIFREGNMMGALAGPDMVRGVAGFGVTITDALRDLADQFQEHGYRLLPPAIVNVAGTTVQATGFTPADIFKRLAEKLEGYEERDFPPLKWGQISREPPV